MSNPVYITGKLKPINNHDTLEKNCKMVLEKHDVLHITSKPPYAPKIYSAYNYLEFPYIVINRALYEIVEREDFPQEERFIASRNLDDTINFELKYDTAVVCFMDAMEQALEQGS